MVVSLVVLLMVLGRFIGAWWPIDDLVVRAMVFLAKGRIHLLVLVFVNL